MLVKLKLQITASKQQKESALYEAQNLLCDNNKLLDGTKSPSQITYLIGFKRSMLFILFLLYAGHNLLLAI
jgi:hypothetical protein